jgi:ferric-dicitrate binding protein FerR (iron transport regulator)
MLSIDFTDAALEEVASMIAKQARSINVIVNKDVAGLRVRNFVVNNISVEEALRAVARAVDVEFQKLNDSTFSAQENGPRARCFDPGSSCVFRRDKAV